MLEAACEQAQAVLLDQVFFSLDEWLKRRALSNQARGARRTFVVADQEVRVFGYYAMAAGAVSHQLATSGVRRNMCDPDPVMVLARLAIDHRAQGIKLGATMIQDAVNRAVSCRTTPACGPCTSTRTMIAPSSSTSITTSRSRHSIP